MATKQKQLLFSVTLKDCTVTTLASRGCRKGGQHQNRTETAVRIVHDASGATAEAHDGKSQHSNKVAAFERMAATDKFKLWLRIETAKRLGQRTPEQIVDEMMNPNNLRTEIKVNDRWVIGEPTF